MGKQRKKSAKRTTTTASQEIPAGATLKAWNRPTNPGGGPAGSGAGPRHAADDFGTDEEMFTATDAPGTPANPPVEEEYPLEKGPPFAGRAGGAVGGSPAQLRSAEAVPTEVPGVAEEAQAAAYSPEPVPPFQAEPELNSIRLVGFEAIEFAEKQNLTLNKHPDDTDGPRVGLNIGDASALAADNPELIWLDVPNDEYYDGPPSSYAPDR